METECVWFNVPLDTEFQSLSRQSIALVLRSKNKVQQNDTRTRNTKNLPQLRVGKI